MTSKIAFTGEVHKAQCECHPGQFVVIVFMMTEEGKRTPAGSAVFATEQLANESLEGLTVQVATDILNESGIDPDMITKVEIGNGEDAQKLETQFFNQDQVIH